MAAHMLSTIDNPFNPWTHYDEWYAWDEQAGYHTTAFLARVARTSNELSETDLEDAIEDAIEEIVRENVSGVHVRVASS